MTFLRELFSLKVRNAIPQRMIFSFFSAFSSQEQCWLLIANLFSLFQLGCYILQSSLKMLFTKLINQSILHMLIRKHSGLSHQRVSIKKTCYTIKLTISQVNSAFNQEHTTSKTLLENLLIWSYDEWLFWDQGNYLVNFLETYCIVSNKIMAFLFFISLLPWKAWKMDCFELIYSYITFLNTAW